MMGGDLDHVDADEAASALSWWLDAGVDVAIQEQPRDWLKSPPREFAAPKPRVEPAEPENAPRAIPETLDLFRDWLRDETDLPFFAPASTRVLPVGQQGAAIMLLTDTPGVEGAAEGRPIGGDPWKLAQRMLAAIGIDPDAAYCASFSCFHAAGTSLRGTEVDHCADIARHHIALAQPKRLLLLGDVPAKALLGKPLAAARGHVHKLEGIRTVATFHPAMMMKYPSNKELAWADLLLLMEEA